MDQQIFQKKEEIPQVNKLSQICILQQNDCINQIYEINDINQDDDEREEIRNSCSTQLIFVLGF